MLSSSVFLLFYGLSFFATWSEASEELFIRTSTTTAEASNLEEIFNILKQYGKKISELEDKNRYLLKEFHQQDRTIIKLKKTVTKQSFLISSLKRFIENCHANSDSSFETTPALSNTTKSRTTSNKNVASKSLKMDIRPKKVEKRINPLVVETAGQKLHAFYAYMTKPLPNPGHSLTLKYDNVITNIGNNYNKFSGIYTAGSNGVYFFSWTTHTAPPHGYLTVELLKNDQVIGVTHVDGENEYNGDAGLVVITLQQGDIVFVRTHPSNSIGGTIMSNESMRTSFVGWCLSC